MKYVNLHYSADDEKDEAWAQAAKEGIPEREWLVEYEMSELTIEGQPVYSAFDSKVHLPERFTKGFPLVPGSTYFAGWDCGTTLNPAFVLLQITPKPWQVHCLVEIKPKVPMAMEQFAPIVANTLARDFSGILLGNIVHAADESGKSRQGATGLSAFDVARKHGFHLIPISNQWARRRGAVDRLLGEWIDDKTPRFVIARNRCPILVQGFEGAYRLRQVSTGINALYGEPVKDVFSHPQDALQYAAVLACIHLDDRGVVQHQLRGSDRKIDAKRYDWERGK